MKLTPAQRLALTTIKAGGARRFVPRYSYGAEAITVPEGRRPISAAVVKRLLDARLCDSRMLPREQQPISGSRHELRITQKGTDALNGITRPPLVAVTIIRIDGEAVGCIESEIDPYEWGQWVGIPAEQQHRLNRMSEQAIAQHVTATTTIGGTE